jgi:hypothetical protein
MKLRFVCRGPARLRALRFDSDDTEVVPPLEVKADGHRDDRRYLSEGTQGRAPLPRSLGETA